MAAVVLAAVAAPGAGSAQEGPPRLRGRVTLDDGPVPDATVVLHRVAMDTAGAVDSTRTAGDGTFSLRLPSMPGREAGGVFFAASRFRGVMYFGPPVNTPERLDSAYVVEVHDTARAPGSGAEIPVAIRHLIIERSGEGWRVTDLVQLRNPGERTYVAADTGATWTYPLPPGATNFEVGQSDLAPEGAAVVGHTLRVTTPIPPGERLFLFRYDLPSLEMALPVPGRTERLELLVREPAPALEAEGLRPGDPVQMEGATYRRYAAAGLPPTTLRLRRAEEGREIPGLWVAAALAVVLAAGAAVALRRSGEGPEGAVAPAGGSPSERSREAVLREIALLDEEFGDDETLDEDERERYRRRRDALKRELRSMARG